MNEDKSGYRTGVVLSEELTKMMFDECQKAKQVISKDQVARKVFTTVKMLVETIDTLRGAIMIAYPGYHGLPEWEPVRQMFENQFDYANFMGDNIEFLEPKNTSIWFAGKELMRSKVLSDYTGKNEKTQIVVKLQKAGAGAPVREAPIDETAYKNMLSQYYKKQEEMKKLEEDNDDHYLSAPWADPKGLKNQLLNGGKNIGWKPK
jgi:hypothetical protein